MGHFVRSKGADSAFSIQLSLDLGIGISERAGMWRLAVIHERTDWGEVRW